jgi:hypothetical protein
MGSIEDLNNFLVQPDLLERIDRLPDPDKVHILSMAAEKLGDKWKETDSSECLDRTIATYDAALSLG